MSGISNTLRGWRWLLLALALAPASQSAIAQGTIVHVQLSTPNPDPNFPWDYEGMRLLGLNPQSYNLDFNGDGNAEFVIVASGHFSTSGFYMYGSGQNAVWANQPFDSHLVVALNAGERIGQSMAPVGEWYETQFYPSGAPRGAVFSSCVDIGCLGYYTGLDSAYAGLQFVSNGQTHYGWVRVGSPLPGFNGGWLYDYAYETRPNTAILAGAGADRDQDGVWDALDQCPDTPAGAVVNAAGCSIDQLCPCNGKWKNHGEYVQSVQSVAARFEQERLLTGQQRADILKQAANSDCGKHH